MLPTPLDSTDLAILNELQRDAKLSNVDLAARIHLSPSPCLARVRELERAGVIQRYVALADPQTLGLNVSVFIQISLDKQVERSLEVFEKAIAEYPQVMECYLMTGDADYMLRVIVADVPALQKFIVGGLARIPGVSNIRSSFALKQVKYETALPVEPVQPAIAARHRRRTIARR
jgi:DNA-binding Lrp family transcriptional regulator